MRDVAYFRSEYKNMAAHIGLLAPAPLSPTDVPVVPTVALSAKSAPCTPLASAGLGPGSPTDAEKQFSRCAVRLRGLRADSGQLRDELNLLFDQLLSENYNRTFEPSINIRPEVKKYSLCSCCDACRLCNETCDAENFIKRV